MGKNVVADWIALVLHSRRTRFLGTIAFIWRWVERGSWTGIHSEPVKEAGYTYTANAPKGWNDSDCRRLIRDTPNIGNESTYGRMMSGRVDDSWYGS